MNRMGTENTLNEKLRQIKEQIRYERGQKVLLQNDNAKISSENLSLVIANRALGEWADKVRSEIRAQRERNEAQAKALESQRAHNLDLKNRADETLKKAHAVLEAAEIVSKRNESEARGHHEAAGRKLHQAGEVEANNLDSEKRIRQIRDEIRSESQAQKKVLKETHGFLLEINNSNNRLNETIQKHGDLLDRILREAGKSAYDRKMADLKLEEVKRIQDETQKSITAASLKLREQEDDLRAREAALSGKIRRSSRR